MGSKTLNCDLFGFWEKKGMLIRKRGLPQDARAPEEEEKRVQTSLDAKTKKKTLRDWGKSLVRRCFLTTDGFVRSLFLVTHRIDFSPPRDKKVRDFFESRRRLLLWGDQRR